MWEKEVIGGCRKLHNGVLNVYSSPDIVTMDCCKDGDDVSETVE
jgi:hypothetical protein